MATFDSLLPKKETLDSCDMLECSNQNSSGNLESCSLPNPQADDSDHSLQLLCQYIRHIYDDNVKLKAAVQRNNVMLQNTLHSVSAFHAALIQKNQAQEVALQGQQKLNQELEIENALILAKFEKLKGIKFSEDQDMLEVPFHAKHYHKEHVGALLKNEMTVVPEVVPFEKPSSDLQDQMCVQNEKSRADIVGKSRLTVTDPLEKIFHSSLKEELGLAIQNLHKVTSGTNRCKDRTNYVSHLASWEMLYARYCEVVNELQALKQETERKKVLSEDTAELIKSTSLKYMKKLDSLTAQLMNSEEKVEQQKIIIKSLNEKIADAEKTSESIPILETQSEDTAELIKSTSLKYLEKLDSLTAQLMNSEEKVEQQKIIIKSLNQKIADMEKTSESIPILETQVEVFKIDYENEKSDREALAVKLKDFEELLRHLQEHFLKT